MPIEEEADLPRGVKILHDPVRNKGTAFTEAERDKLGLRGLLPPRVCSPAEQELRVLGNLCYDRLRFEKRRNPVTGTPVDGVTLDGYTDGEGGADSNGRFVAPDRALLAKEERAMVRRPTRGSTSCAWPRRPETWTRCAL